MSNVHLVPLYTISMPSKLFQSYVIMFLDEMEQ